MRHIDTSEARLEELKLQAKRQKSSRGGKQGEILDQVARSAGYLNWHHVEVCRKQSVRRQVEAGYVSAHELREVEISQLIEDLKLPPGTRALGYAIQSKDSELFLSIASGEGDPSRMSTSWRADPSDAMLWPDIVDAIQAGKTLAQNGVSRLVGVVHGDRQGLLLGVLFESAAQYAFQPVSEL